MTPNSLQDRHAPEPLPLRVSQMYGRDVTVKRDLTAKRWALAALAAAVLGALVVAFAPLREFCTATLPIDAGRGPAVAAESCRRDSMFSTEGARILVVVGVPVFVALIGALMNHRAVRAAAAVLLWICYVLALASVGMLFVPAAILMTVAAAQHRPAPIMPPVPGAPRS